MIHLFFAFLALSSGSIFASLYGKRYEEILPITMMSSILILYLFYIFNILFIGLYLIWAIMLCMYIYFGYKFIKEDKKERKQILKNIFTPAFVIFILCFIIIAILTYNRRALLWDELRLWAAYPKILYYDGDKATLLNIMQSYEPGMPLFQYFFTKTAGVFKESYLFLSYAILGLAVFMPILKKLEWKKWYLIPIFIFILIMLPLSLANSNHDSLTYYYTLFIEPMLGLFFAYTLYLSTQDIKDDKLNLLTFILGVITLSLLKDTGILFAIFSSLSFILINLMKKDKKGKLNKRKILIILLPIICSLFIFGSWKVVQKVYETKNYYAQTVEKSEFKDILTNPSEEQINIIKEFAYEVLHTPIIITNDNILTKCTTYINLMILLFILYLINICLQDKKYRKETLISSLMYFVGSNIFVIGTLGVYLFSLHLVASFARYVSTVIVAAFIFLSLMILRRVLSNETNNNFKCYCYIVLIIFLLVLPMRMPSMINEEDLETFDLVSLEYSNKITSELNNKKDNFILIFTDDYEDNLAYVIFHHNIYLDLIDEGFKYPDILLVNENDTLNSLNDTLKNYDYAYLIAINEEDFEVFNDVFDKDIDKSSLLTTTNYEIVN